MKQLLVLLILILTLSACQSLNEPETITAPVSEDEPGFSQLPEETPEIIDGYISPDGSTLIRVRYDEEEGKKGKWYGYYIDVISIDGDFENYSIPTAVNSIECWLSNRYFIYDYGKGSVQIFDLQENESIHIGPQFASVDAVEDDKIILSDLNGEHDSVIIEYSFAEDGSIIIYDPYCADN
ncbi:MAG: hypothetical protein J1F63_04365 [Oscillospiraceae bacterium]|nr:hypothetical protein [Oscillospiraceae bacterium]